LTCANRICVCSTPSTRRDVGDISTYFAA